MEMKHFTYPSVDGKTMIHGIEWIPDTQPVCVLQLVHGMQEFIDRYDHFARYMCERGILVAGNDHLGHGASVLSDEKYGYFAEENGNRALISDMRHLHERMSERYPGVPYVMLGHSMGSFLARQYICLYGNKLDGAIISGTAWHSAAEARAGMAICRIIARRKGWSYRSSFVNNMAMGNLNRRFEPARTKYEWLTRDEKVVDAYRKDSRTQFIFTLNAFYAMFSNLLYLTDQKNLRRIPSDLPLLFIAGEMDPVGNFGTGVKKSVLSVRSAGVKNVQCHLYPNDRHEVLNELNKEEVYTDILKWLNRQVISVRRGER